MANEPVARVGQSVVGCGVDIIEIDRIEKTVGRFGNRFLERVYTSQESAYCRSRPEKLAGRFAAKEAVSKALGTGIRGIRWREIEVLPDVRGKPTVRLFGSARRRAEELGITDLQLSISHSRDHAIALVVAVHDHSPVK